MEETDIQEVVAAHSRKRERVSADVRKYSLKNARRTEHYKGSQGDHREGKLLRKILSGAFGNEKKEIQERMVLGTSGFNNREI